MKIRIVWCVVSFVCGMGVLWGETPALEVREEGMIRIDVRKMLPQGEGDSRIPLFFDLFPDGTIGIPVPAAGGVVLIDQEGTRKGVLSLPLSGVINYFGIGPGGGVVLFMEGSLYCFDRGGEMIWYAPFPLGLLPEGVYPGEGCVYFKAHGTEGMIGAGLPLSPPFQAKKMTEVRDGAHIPYLEIGGRRVGYVLGEHLMLLGTELPEHLRSLRDARFMGMREEDGLSIWVKKDGASFYVLMVDESGGVRGSQIISGGSSSSWWWGVYKTVGGSGFLYLHEPLDDEAFVIRRFKLDSER